MSIDPTVIRLLFVLGLFLSFGAMFIAYLVLMVVIPEEPVDYPAPQDTLEPK